MILSVHKAVNEGYGIERCWRVKGHELDGANMGFSEMFQRCSSILGSIYV